MILGVIPVILQKSSARVPAASLTGAGSPVAMTIAVSAGFIVIFFSDAFTYWIAKAQIMNKVKITRFLFISL